MVALLIIGTNAMAKVMVVVFIQWLSFCFHIITKLPLVFKGIDPKTYGGKCKKRRINR
jgi:hypothetical protein